MALNGSLSREDKSALRSRAEKQQSLAIHFQDKVLGNSNDIWNKTNTKILKYAFLSKQPQSFSWISEGSGNTVSITYFTISAPAFSLTETKPNFKYLHCMVNAEKSTF